MSSEGRKKARRSYRPGVEPLEAMRLFSGAAPTLPDVAAQHAPLADPQALGDHASWDAALDDSALADLLTTSQAPADAAAIRSGLDQLDRYLGRTWYRAGIAPQKHDDCTQMVYLTLLMHLGRDGFDRLAAEVGHSGIRDVLSSETDAGPDFFRAVDMVKKRALRERAYQPLDGSGEVASDPGDEAKARWRDALHEAMDHALNPRETALVLATLRGESPSDIAQEWGVAPKTVSNEKTRALQKLREFLAAAVAD